MKGLSRLLPFVAAVAAVACAEQGTLEPRREGVLAASTKAASQITVMTRNMYVGADVDPVVIATVALVGYTNAGKTTLFNALTGEDARASNALFVTLDPLVRRVKLPDQRQLLVSGEQLVRVPPKLMAPERRAGRTRGKSDPIDALAVHFGIGSM